MTIYDKGQKWVEGEYPAILAIGDSWFCYPQNNILLALAKHKLLNSDYAHMQVVGTSGALLQEFVGAGRFAADVAANLAPQNRKFFNVFMISGAGNDGVGKDANSAQSDNYALALKPDCTGINVAKDCLDPVGLDNLMRRVSTALGGLIHDIYWAYKDEPAKQRLIIIHGYDNSIPDGRPFKVFNIPFGGPWLKPAMDAAKVKDDLAFRTEISKELNDELNRLLKRFAEHDKNIVYINSSGTLSTGADYQQDWDNELHPTVEGYAKIVDQCWIPELQKWGIAKLER